MVPFIAPLSSCAKASRVSPAELKIRNKRTTTECRFIVPPQKFRYDVYSSLLHVFPQREVLPGPLLASGVLLANHRGKPAVYGSIVTPKFIRDGQRIAQRLVLSQLELGFDPRNAQAKTG